MFTRVSRYKMGNRNMQVTEEDVAFPEEPKRARIGLMHYDTCILFLLVKLRAMPATCRRLDMAMG